MKYLHNAVIHSIIFFAALSLPLSAYAEYYLVYPPSSVSCVTCSNGYVAKKKYRSYHKSPYYLSIRTRYVCPAVISCNVVPAAPCMQRYYKKCRYKKHSYMKQRQCYRGCQKPAVIFSGLPTSYEGAERVDDFNVSYDLRTADDDVYTYPGMNFGY